MTLHTEVLINHAVNLIKNCKNNAGFSKLSQTPSHLMYDVRRIEKQWELHGTILEGDIKYLSEYIPLFLARMDKMKNQMLFLAHH